MYPTFWGSSFFVGGRFSDRKAFWDDGDDFDTNPRGSSGDCVALRYSTLEREGCSATLRYICERPVDLYDPCSNKPCVSGICTSYGCSFKCKCPVNFYGHRCEQGPIKITLSAPKSVGAGGQVTVRYTVKCNAGEAKFELYANGRILEKHTKPLSNEKITGSYTISDIQNDVYVTGKGILEKQKDAPIYECAKISVLRGKEKSVEVANDKCNGTVLSVNWKGLGTEESSKLAYDVYVAKMRRGNSAGPDTYTITGLEVDTQYSIQVVPNIEGCTGLDLFESYPVKTSKGAPGPPTVIVPRNVVRTSQCTVTWTKVRPYTIGGYKISAIEQSRNFLKSIHSMEMDVNSSESSSFSSETFKFPTNPNSIYHVKVGTKPPEYCQEVPIAWSSEQIGCRTESAPPNKVPTPTKATSGTAQNTASITLNPVDERNGLISCYIVVVEKLNQSTSVNDSSPGSNDLSRIKQANEAVDDGDSFVALAIERFNNTKALVIGDGRTTCCNMGGISKACEQNNTRRRRAVDKETVQAENHQLVPGASYTYYIIVSTPNENGGEPWVTASPKSDPWFVEREEEETEGSNLVPIILPIVLIVMIIAILLVAGFLYKRKRSKGKGRGVPGQKIPMRPNRRVEEPIVIDISGENPNVIVERLLARHAFQLANLFQRMEEKRANEDMLFLEEFKTDIPKAIQQCGLTTDFSQLPANRSKNRYKNIVPYDKTRVELQKMPGEEFSDYINASFFDGYKFPSKFIATQGPQPETIADFWRMIWEQGCCVIAILTRLAENKKVKCAQYWSEDEPAEYGGIIVKLLDTMSYGDYIRRRFELTRDEEVKEVFQFHFIAWPDHGTPDTTSSLLRFHKSVLQSQPDSAGPIVVHCSAGVGRTGTFIALDIVSEQIAQTDEINIAVEVGKMRTRRPQMVQTLDQYVLIHKLILELYQFGETDVDVPSFTSIHNKLQRRDFDQEFAQLDYFLPLDTDQETGRKQTNRHLNRDSSVIPYDHNAAFIQMTPMDSSVPYYNASVIASYHANDRFIAAQTPEEDSADMFWRAVIDNDVAMIVAICPINEKENFCYWPERAEESKYGTVSVRTIKETSDMGCIEREFEVSTKDKNMTVSHIVYGQWLDDVAPASSGILLEIIARVERHHQTLTNCDEKTTLVHCSDGSGRTGSFCAISNLIERLKNENRVDVFRTVKDLRDQRPMMVRTVGQYEFCYQAVSEFLQSFDLYGNFQ